MTDYVFGNLCAWIGRTNLGIVHGRNSPQSWGWRALLDDSTKSVCCAGEIPVVEARIVSLKCSTHDTSLSFNYECDRRGIHWSAKITQFHA